MEEPTKGKGPTRNILIAVAALFMQGFALYVLLHHEQEHGADYMSLFLTLVVTLVSWAVLIWAVVRNWRDAVRAKALQAQIQTIKDDSKTKLDHATAKITALEGQATEARRRSGIEREGYSQEVQNLQGALQLERSHWDSWRSAGKFDVLAAEARALAVRLDELRVHAIVGGAQLPETLKFPLSDGYQKIPETQWEWFHHQVWRFREDFMVYQGRASYFALQVQTELTTTRLPATTEIDGVIKMLEVHAKALADQVAELLNYR